MSDCANFEAAFRVAQIDYERYHVTLQPAVVLEIGLELGLDKHIMSFWFNPRDGALLRITEEEAL